jgi:hypothetical protein
VARLATPYFGVKGAYRSLKEESMPLIGGYIALHQRLDR